MSPREFTLPNQNATINGIIASVSLVRPSKYFDGKLTNGDTTLRFVGFHKQQQQLLNSYCKQQKPIKIKNCQNQFNKFNHQLEIMTQNIELPTMKFSVPDLKTVGSKEIKLSKQEEYDKVSRSSSY